MSLRWWHVLICSCLGLWWLGLYESTVFKDRLLSISCALSGIPPDFDPSCSWPHTNAWLLAALPLAVLATLAIFRFIKREPGNSK